jgi:hypothetical protein
MKTHAGRCAALALPLALLLGLGLPDQPAGAIEIKGGASSAGGSASSATASTRVASGVVTAVDRTGGWLVLDGARRFVFDPRTLAVRRQGNPGASAPLSDVGVGTRVSLTLVKRSASAAEKVSEVWIAP